MKTYKETQRKERSRQRPATGLTEVFSEQGVTWADRALDIRPASPCDHPGTALWQKDGLDARYTYGIERTRQELAGLMEGVAGFNLRERWDTRLAFRPQMQEEAEECIRKARTDEKFSVQGLLAADMALDEAEWSMKQKMRQTTRAQDRMKQAEHDTR